MLTLSDLKKVEERLPRYLTNYPQGDMRVTEKAVARADVRELRNYELLLKDAFVKRKMDKALYDRAIGLVGNWDRTTLYEKFALGLLIKKTRDDTALWDLLASG